MGRIVHIARARAHAHDRAMDSSPPPPPPVASPDTPMGIPEDDETPAEAADRLLPAVLRGRFTPTSAVRRFADTVSLIGRLDAAFDCFAPTTDEATMAAYDAVDGRSDCSWDAPMPTELIIEASPGRLFVSVETISGNLVSDVMVYHHVDLDAGRIVGTVMPEPLGVFVPVGGQIIELD